ncbi:MAG: DinB family protein, partial [Anaerolineaceae bacterium]|nr:DinB family protein [Anaerolineaceae bacterium]
MIDFTPLRDKKVTIADLAAELTKDDLVKFTHELNDKILDMISSCQDSDVIFEPKDPKANDPYAEDPADIHIAWTLGHLIVHITASMEESAALAAEMARGVEFHGRSRSEIPWQTIKTIAQCRHRMEESRRMCIASLEMWPDEPYLDNTHKPWESMPPIDARGRYLLGFTHTDSHLEQIMDVI